MNEIKVFITDAILDFEEYKSHLCPERIEYINSFKNAAIQNEKTTASILTDYALKQIGLTDGTDRIIAYGENKKPRLKNSKAYFNVSHSHKTCAVAVSLYGEVGLDIEKSRILPSLKLTKKIFTTAEYKRLLDLPINEQSDHVLKRWTLCESCLKLNSKDISTLFDSSFTIPTKISANLYSAPPSINIRYTFCHNTHISCATNFDCDIKILIISKNELLS